MITPDEAWELVCAHARPLPAIDCPLERALDCVLAAPVAADRDYPPTDRAAMDGYAVRSSDTVQAPSRLTVAGEIAAGSAPTPDVAPGHCVRIFTGASVPFGADAVVRQEDARAEANLVTILEPVTPGTDILRRGENARAGDVLIAPGTRLTPGTIGTCAATGHASVCVYRRPSVHVLTTGAELRATGDSVAPHQIRDSNGPMIEAALAAAGIAGIRLSRLPDEPGRIADAVRDALESADVVITIGGVSAGRYDYVPDCIAQAGGVIRFHQVAIRPGKPLVFATTSSGQLIWGLPGNPVSAMVTFHEFVRPSLLMLAGMPPSASRRSLRLPLREAVRAKGKLRTHVPARLLSDDSGVGVAPVRSAGSADFVALGQADGAIVLPEGVGGLEAGAPVGYHPWGDAL